MSADTLTICCHQEANRTTAARVAEPCRKVRIWSKLPASCDASAPVCLSFPNIKLTHPLQRLVHPSSCFPASRQLMNFKKPPRWRPQETLARLIEAHKTCFVLGLLFFCFVFPNGWPSVLGFPLCHWRPGIPGGRCQSWRSPGREWRSSGPRPSAGHLQGLFEGGTSVSLKAETETIIKRRQKLEPSLRRREHTITPSPGQ